jgi:NAD(P)-dependent dehydrogenase (short-subunit alcohol dehydrogenase family)
MGLTFTTSVLEEPRKTSHPFRVRTRAHCASVINETLKLASVNSDMPNPMLLPYATTKGAIQNFTRGLAQMLGGKGIRANAVAPRPYLDALDPVDDARRRREEFRQAGPDETARPSVSSI